MLSKDELEEYQKLAIKLAYVKKRYALFMMMGCGKTITALTIIWALFKNKKIKRCLIVAPTTAVEDTWMDEIEKWQHIIEELHPESLFQVGKADRAEVLKTTDANVIVASHGIVKSIVDEKLYDFDCVIIDESTFYKNHRSVKYKALYNASRKTPYIYLLSGTPSPNDYTDMYAQIKLLDGGRTLGTTLTTFRKRWCVPSDLFVGGRAIQVWKFNMALKDKFLKKIEHMCFFMDSPEVLDLPHIEYKNCMFDLNRHAQIMYYHMKNRHVVHPSGTLDLTNMVRGRSAAAVVDKLRQISNGVVYNTEGLMIRVHDCKLLALRDLMDDDDKNYIIVFGYKHDLVGIRAMLPNSVEYRDYVGVKDDWNAGKIKYLLLHPQSAGYSLNLQKGGSEIIFFSMPWSYGAYAQVIARVYRRGQKDKVVVKRLMMNSFQTDNGKWIPSVDIAVAESLERKETGQQYIFDKLGLKGY